MQKELVSIGLKRSKVKLRWKTRLVKRVPKLSSTWEETVTIVVPMT